VHEIHALGVKFTLLRRFAFSETTVLLGILLECDYGIDTAIERGIKRVDSTHWHIGALGLSTETQLKPAETYEQPTKKNRGVHVNRVARRDCHYCHPGGDVVASLGPR